MEKVLVIVLMLTPVLITAAADRLTCAHQTRVSTSGLVVDPDGNAGGKVAEN